VHPLADPETGATRDVIIKELVATSVYHDRPTGRCTWNRLVPGINVKIPWPKREPVVHEDQPCDTLRIDVERKTFVPTLARPPVPESVIDELRNRFSKFRTRHTEEYVAQKQAEVDAKKARKAGGGVVPESMLTPVQEHNRMVAEKRAAAPPPVLTDSMLAKIGEVMAKNRERALAAAGVISEDKPAEVNSSGSTVPPPPAELPVENHPPSS
jgi:large subunit ribosomal protein L24